MKQITIDAWVSCGEGDGDNLNVPVTLTDEDYDVLHTICLEHKGFVDQDDVYRGSKKLYSALMKIARDNLSEDVNEDDVSYGFHYEE